MSNLGNPQAVKLSSEQPLIVGLLVDVSGSMSSSIRNESGSSLNRLQSFQHSLKELADKAQALSGSYKGLIKVFAYGFGFGNFWTVFISNDEGPQVRDLLNKPGEIESTITLDYLADHWTSYQDHIQGLAQYMFGSTPMGEGFQRITDRFELEWKKHETIYSSILFVLSDGEPTDVSPEYIVDLAENLKSKGVLIVSCYVTSADITKPRHLYGCYQEDWTKDAKLMFDCASKLPTGSVFENYIKEKRWTSEKDGRLFTQVNQSEILSEFLGIIVSPIKQPDDGQRRRWEKQRDSLQQYWDTKNDKLIEIRKSLAIETDALNKFKYEQQIKKEEEELRELSNRLNKMEEDLKKKL